MKVEYLHQQLAFGSHTKESFEICDVHGRDAEAIYKNIR